MYTQLYLDQDIKCIMNSLNHAKLHCSQNNLMKIITSGWINPKIDEIYKSNYIKLKGILF